MPCDFEKRASESREFCKLVYINNIWYTDWTVEIARLTKYHYNNMISRRV
jgi:hypothetical protein